MGWNESLEQRLQKSQTAKRRLFKRKDDEPMFYMDEAAGTDKSVWSQYDTLIAPSTNPLANQVDYYNDIIKQQGGSWSAMPNGAIKLYPPTGTWTTTGGLGWPTKQSSQIFDTDPVPEPQKTVDDVLAAINILLHNIHELKTA